MPAGTYQRCLVHGCRRKVVRYDRCLDHASDHINHLIYGLSPEFGEAISDLIDMRIALHTQNYHTAPEAMI